VAVSWPRPTRADHERFCRIEGWKQVRDARGRTGTHHLTYELDLPDGRLLRTRVSHPPDRTDYGPGIWRHVLRDQLDVSEEQFWACVRDGTVPGRSAQQTSRDALPAEVVHLLLTRVGLAEPDVAAMTREQAVARLARYWTEGG
jgi:hypothetical protein